MHRLGYAGLAVLSLFATMGQTCTAVGFPIIPGGPIGGGPFVDPGVTVTIINNTNFDIDPMIDYDDIDGNPFFLDLGIVFPGEVVSTDFFCDEVIFLTSTNAEQYVFGDVIVLEALPFFEQDFDFFCGEEVTFEFIGDDLNFDVIVDADGFVIY
jgi:hypothetical protein